MEIVQTIRAGTMKCAAWMGKATEIAAESRVPGRMPVNTGVEGIRLWDGLMFTKHCRKV